jgi:hypothetical protein
LHTLSPTTDRLYAKFSNGTCRLHFLRLAFHASFFFYFLSVFSFFPFFLLPHDFYYYYRCENITANATAIYYTCITTTPIVDVAADVAAAVAIIIIYVIITTVQSEYIYMRIRRERQENRIKPYMIPIVATSMFPILYPPILYGEKLETRVKKLFYFNHFYWLLLGGALIFSKLICNCIRVSFLHKSLNEK